MFKLSAEAVLKAMIIMYNSGNSQFSARTLGRQVPTNKRGFVDETLCFDWHEYSYLLDILHTEGIVKITHIDTDGMEYYKMVK